MFIIGQKVFSQPFDIQVSNLSENTGECCMYMTDMINNNVAKTKAVCDNDITMENVSFPLPYDNYEPHRTVAFGSGPKKGYCNFVIDDNHKMADFIQVETGTSKSINIPENGNIRLVNLKGQEVSCCVNSECIQNTEENYEVLYQENYENKNVTLSCIQNVNISSWSTSGSIPLIK